MPAQPPPAAPLPQPPPAPEQPVLPKEASTTDDAAPPPPEPRLSRRERRRKERREQQQQHAPAPTAEELAELRRTSRLSIPDFARIPLAAAIGFSVGMGLGVVQGSKMSGLRFRAEHAHKLPTTQRGWFLYHKTKNYHMALGGLKEGVKMGAKIGFMTTAMFGIENMFDRYRGSADFVNTVLASVSVAGGFSLWNRFPLIMAARTTKTALVVGLAYGGLQDLVGFARGRPIGYVDYLRRRFGSNEDKNKPSQPST